IPLPSAICGPIPDDILAAVISRPFPILHDQALVEREVDFAFSHTRPVITYGPVSEPEIKLPMLATGAWFRIVRMYWYRNHHRNASHQKTGTHNSSQKIHSFVH